MQRHVEGHRLDEEHCRQIVGGIDPEQRGGGAVPEELAHRAAVLGGAGWSCFADREVEAEPDLALARKPLTLGHARVQLVGGHQFDGGGLEDVHTIESPLAEEHPGKAHVIIDRRGEAESARGELVVLES